MGKILYWVGGSGSFSSSSHWSETNNGIGGINPLLYNDATFIINDNSGDNSLSIILDKAIKCNDFILKRTKPTVFTGSVSWSANHSISISGTLTSATQQSLICNDSVELKLQNKTSLESSLQFSSISSSYGVLDIKSNIKTDSLSAKNIIAKDINITTDALVLDGNIQINDCKIFTKGLNISPSSIGSIKNTPLSLEEGGNYTVNSLNVLLDNVILKSPDTYHLLGGMRVNHLESNALILYLDGLNNFSWISTDRELTINSNLDKKATIDCNGQNIVGDIKIGTNIENVINGSISEMEVLYWIGGNGSFIDANHWSTTSGGVSSGKSPTFLNKCIIDDNSSTTNDFTINITSDIHVFSLVDQTSTKKVKVDATSSGNLYIAKDLTLLPSSDNADTNLKIITEKDIVEKNISISGYAIESIELSGQKVNILNTLSQVSSNSNYGVIIKNDNTNLYLNNSHINGTIMFSAEDTSINCIGDTSISNNSSKMIFKVDNIKYTDTMPKVIILESLANSTNSISIEGEIPYLEIQNCKDTISYSIKSNIEILKIYNPANQTLHLTSDTIISVDKFFADTAKLDIDSSLGATILLPERNVFLFNTFNSGSVSIQNGVIISNNELRIGLNNTLHLEGGKTYLLTDLVLPADTHIEIEGSGTVTLDLNNKNYISTAVLPSGVVLVNGTITPPAYVTLKDENGEYIYPKTFANKVLIDSGRTLTDELNENFGKIFGSGLTDIFVNSLTGVDTNNGKSDTPFKTLNRAFQEIPSSSNAKIIINYTGNNNDDIGGSVYSVNNCDITLKLKDVEIRDISLIVNGTFILDMDNSKISHMKILNSNITDNSESNDVFISNLEVLNSILDINSLRTENTIICKNSSVSITDTQLTRFSLTGLFDLQESVAKVKHITTAETVPYIAKLDHVSRIIYN